MEPDVEPNEDKALERQPADEVTQRKGSSPDLLSAPLDQGGAMLAVPTADLKSRGVTAPPEPQ